MSLNRADQASVGNNYEKGYYDSHYGQLIGDPVQFRLLSLYWRHELFTLNGIDAGSRVLDYGGGLGQVTAALPNVTIFDPSPYAEEFARQRNAEFVSNRDNIPAGSFDVIVSSHSLEHSPAPSSDLVDFHRYARAGARLVLVLPAEAEMYKATRPLDVPRLEVDLHDQHFYAWTFQTITNLLSYCGWRAVSQKKIYGPFMLRSLAKVTGPDTSIAIAHVLGRAKKNYPSLLTIAERAPE